MKSITVDLDALRTVAAAALDADGVLLEANAGFLRLMPATGTPPIGAKVTRFFLQPDFATLAQASSDDVQGGYRGLLSIGDSAGTTRTLRGRVWRAGTELRLLAEYDIDELERLTEVVLELNRDASVAQHTLTRANFALQQREVQIVKTSLTDTLTGVGNRRSLDQTLTAEIGRVQRYGGTLSAIMADVDHFKLVNDQYGHGTGDNVLAGFGALLGTRIRATDTVARFGGEEFVVLMPNTHLAQAQLKAEQIRAALAAELIAPLTAPVTASFGVAELAPDEDGASLLRRVDVALYRAKQGGRNRVST